MSKNNSDEFSIDLIVVMKIIITYVFINAALYNRAGHLYFHAVVSSIFFLWSFFPRLISAVAD